MPINSQFASHTASFFAPTGFVPRAKGQRCMPDLLPPFLFMESLPVGFWVTLVGESRGYGPNGQVVWYDLLIVATPSGVRVPAYKRQSVESHCICQYLNYVPSEA